MKNLWYYKYINILSGNRRNACWCWGYRFTVGELKQNFQSFVEWEKKFEIRNKKKSFLLYVFLIADRSQPANKSEDKIIINEIEARYKYFYIIHPWFCINLSSIFYKLSRTRIQKIKYILFNRIGDVHITNTNSKCRSDIWGVQGVFV